MQTTKIFNGANKTIYWAVRAFAVLFVLFTAMFALDVNPFSWLALLMHLLPTIVLLIILIISWNKEKIGGILWALAAIGLLIMAWGNDNLLTYLIIAGPPLLIGILFLWPKQTTPKPLVSKQPPVSKPPSSNNMTNIR